jgi:hypothetical protein
LLLRCWAYAIATAYLFAFAALAGVEVPIFPVRLNESINSRMFDTNVRFDLPA